MKTWIGDGCDTYTVGQVGFLRERCAQQGTDSFSLSDHPGRTNMSHEIRYDGWLGTTDNVAAYAHGVARVARVTANGRALVVRLTGAQERAALNTLGYPDLA